MADKILSCACLDFSPLTYNAERVHFVRNFLFHFRKVAVGVIVSIEAVSAQLHLLGAFLFRLSGKLRCPVSCFVSRISYFPFISAAAAAAAAAAPIVLFVA